jgi:o-succinylbenzoate synthase
MVAPGGPSASLSERWQRVGSGGRIRFEVADLWMLDLPFVEPVVTAAGEHRRRPLVMLRVMGTTDDGVTEGWGECASLADDAYDREDADRSFRALHQTLLPGLVAGLPPTRHLPGPSELAMLRRTEPQAPMAFAALEMAVADAHLRAEGRSLAGLLGVEGRAVRLGAVVGVAPSEPALVDRVAALAERGYTRVKLKIGPGWDVAPVEAVSRAVPGVRLQVDANGSYTEGDRSRLVELDRFGLLCLEQPFAPEDLAAHVRLARHLRTPVCLDESVHSGGEIAEALALGACSVVCLKPARLGGLGEALAVIDSCAATGTPVWMGGMFESGYARAVNLTLAALPAFRWPGDLSPARSYLQTDLVTPPELVRVGESGSVAARPPSGLGMGEAPDLDTVTRLAVQHVRVGPF